MGWEGVRGNTRLVLGELRRVAKGCEGDGESKSARDETRCKIPGFLWES